MKQIAKPSSHCSCIKKVTELYPTSKHVPVKRLREAFDECMNVLLSELKEEKIHSLVKPVFLEFAILPPFHPIVIPKGKKQQELVQNGRMKKLQIRHTMSSLQVRNAIVAGFKHLKL